MANTVGREMGIAVVEGGPFYRRLAYATLQNGINLGDTAQLVELAAAAPSQFTTSEANSTTNDGQDITSALRSEAVSTTVSAMQQIVKQRKHLAFPMRTKQQLMSQTLHQTSKRLCCVSLLKLIN